jgi:hypothetical protein
MQVISLRFPCALFLALVVLLAASTLRAEEPPAKVPDATAAQEKKAKKKYPDIDVGGEMELEYVDTQMERDSLADRTEYPSGRLQIDFAGVTVKASLSEDIFARLEARFRPAEPVDLQEAIFRVEGLPAGGYVQLGWDNRIMKPRRRTEAYPLVGTAFWKGKELALGAGIDLELFRIREKGSGDAGLDAPGKKGKTVHSLSLVFEASVGNGMPLGKRPAGEDPSFRVLGYDEMDIDFNAGKEAALLLGVKGRLFSALRYDLSAFACASTLTDEDRQVLWDLPGYGTPQSRDHYFYGYTARLRWEGIEFLAHLCNGRLGRLGRAAWFVQASYRFRWKGIEALGTRLLSSLRPIFRYGALDLDTVPDPADSLTWDRERITAALHVEIMDNALLKIEYTVNNETTGDRLVLNDELVVQVEVRF